MILSHKPRLVVRKSNNNIALQIVEYHPEGDRALASAHSKELMELGYTGHGGNAKAGYLVGYLGGTRAVKNKIDKGVAPPVKGSTVFAVLLGAIEAGLDVPHNKEILPPVERFSDLADVKKKITGA